MTGKTILIKETISMIQILAGTSNKHKVEEFKSAISHLLPDLQILMTSDFPSFPDVEENGTSFEENASIKAKHASAYADMPAFADDSGLEVMALNGEPGIYSARYAGEKATDAEKMAKVLAGLEGKSDRRARFVCVIALAAGGEITQLFRGEVHGVIAHEPRGDHGFGYDPIFIPDGYDKTFGELGAEIKEKISHRAVALEKMTQFLQKELENMEGFELQ